MDKIKILNLTKPVEWENTHIQAHEEINKAISQFHSHFNNVVDEYNNLIKMFQETDGKLTSSFSEINKLKKENKELRETLVCMAEQIKDLKEEMSKWGKYLSINYEWIVDTDTEVAMELDTIELDGNKYLVNIRINEASPNQWTMAYMFPDLSIASGSYTPVIHLMAKDWEHAVLEYDFTVILTQI